jgi:hypothetical protein
MSRLVICSILCALTAACASERSNSNIPASYWSSTPPPRAIQPTPPLHPGYTVLEIKDTSTWTLEKESKPERSRFEVSITAPAAKTFEERGQTVVAACTALQREREAHVVRVWLEPNANTRGLGFVLAMATYSPDGKGMSGLESGEVWSDLSATDYQPSALVLRMTKDSRLRDISEVQAKIIMSRRPFQP